MRPRFSHRAALNRHFAALADMPKRSSFLGRVSWGRLFGLDDSYFIGTLHTWSITRAAIAGHDAQCQFKLRHYPLTGVPAAATDMRTRTAGRPSLSVELLGYQLSQFREDQLSRRKSS